MKKIRWFIALMIISAAFAVHGQSKAKFNPNIGFGTYKLLDEKLLGGERAHPVQKMGFDIVLEEKGWIFMPGFHLYRIAVAPESFSLNEIFKKRSHANYGKIPLVFGYKILPNSLAQLGAYGGANLGFFINVQDNDLNLNNEDFKGVNTSLEFGVRALFLRHLTLNLHYDHGLNPLIKFRKDSKARGWILSAGVIF